VFERREEGDTVRGEVVCLEKENLGGDESEEARKRREEEDQDDTSLLPPAFELPNDTYIYISRLYRKTEYLHRIKTFFFAKHILYDWLPRQPSPHTHIFAHIHKHGQAQTYVHYTHTSLEAHIHT